MAQGGLTKSHWRKHWQWFEIMRPHAQLVADDEFVSPCSLCCASPCSLRAKLAMLADSRLASDSAPFKQLVCRLGELGTGSREIAVIVGLAALPAFVQQN